MADGFPAYDDVGGWLQDLLDALCGLRGPIAAAEAECAMADVLAKRTQARWSVWRDRRYEMAVAKAGED